MSAPKTALPASPPEILIGDVDGYLSVSTKQTTGGHVWDAARVLLAYLSENPQALGGGTGAAAIAAAGGEMPRVPAPSLRPPLAAAGGPA